MIEITRTADVLRHLDGMEAVIFDLDDTLYAEKAYVKSGFQAIADLHPEIPGLFHELWDGFTGYPSPLFDVMKRHGYSGRRKEIVRQYESHDPDIHLFPGVKEMLDRLRDGGIRMGMISDGSPERQKIKIRKLGLLPYMEHIILTDEYGGTDFRKPHPRAFYEMSEKLGIPFEKMIFVGDNLHRDIPAPEALGMRAIHFWYPDGVYFEK